MASSVLSGTTTIATVLQDPDVYTLCTSLMMSSVRPKRWEVTEHHTLNQLEKWVGGEYRQVFEIP
jgi:hypothetical protein